MRRPKGKLLALVVLTGAIGVAAATGAFTVVQAQRTAQVNVAGDVNALLAIEEYDSNSPYTSSSGGTFQIHLDGNDGTNAGGQGINQNAATDFGNLTTITNQGSQPVTVWIQVDTNDASDLNNPDERILFYTHNYNRKSITNPTTLGEATDASQFSGNKALVITQGTNGATMAVRLQPGESIDVGLHIDLMGAGLSQNGVVVEEINILAVSNPASGDVTKTAET